jgi:membrane-bound lytic murein transglycosylase A
MPGWDRAQLEPSLRAFIAGCARFKRVCDVAKSLPPGDEQAARAFFEAEFAPYALVSTTTGDTGLITGYYEPIVDGSRVSTAQHRIPIFGVPDDLIVVDLPETRQLRLRGRVEGRRLIPYYSRAEIDARGEVFAAPVLA